VAAEADREATKLKQVRIMIPKMGEDFPGKIVGMVESGMFVQVDHPYVEGMVSQESMTTDFFQFNPEKMVFLGKRTRQAFKIGDPVKVKCANVDLDRRRIDFVLVT
jgi:ribonuclease R